MYVSFFIESHYECGVLLFLRLGWKCIHGPRTMALEDFFRGRVMLLKPRVLVHTI